MVTYFIDSDMDLTLEHCKKYGFRLISMPYSIDGKTIYPYEDFETFECHEYYEKLREGTMPTTSGISKEKYLSYFEPEFAAGNDICYFHFSKAMSNTFDFMKQAVDELTAKYPERKFYQLDTKSITTLGAVIALAIGDDILSGMGVEELLEKWKTEIDHYAVYMFVDDLKFFKRSGRVSGLSATMGTLLGIRPVINITEEGIMQSCGTCKGRAKSVAYLVDQVAALGDHVKDYRFVIGHTDAPELVEEVLEGLKEQVGEDLQYEIIPASPTTGGHSGPDGVAVAFHAIHR